MTPRGPRTGESGFSLVELLISTAIMLVVTGAIFNLMNPAQGNAQAQPEAADIQQRMRVSTDALFKELIIAGAGPYQGPITGSLMGFFAPILPRKIDDPATGTGSFSPDKITITYIPNSYSQTTITSAMPDASAELKVADQPNCPQGEQLCGFSIGMDVIIFDTAGHFDLFTITQVQNSAGHLQHRDDTLSYPYDVGASIMAVVTNTYYRDAATNQLMKYDGHKAVPIADNVVDLRFDYFGDPNPPVSPKPPLGVANCLYDASGNYVSGLSTLTATDGSLAALTPAMLTDGPYCGSGQNQFDADLLRVRKVKVMLRVQAASRSLRGSDPVRFRNAGTSTGGERFIPDLQLSFDVSPRNLNLTR